MQLSITKNENATVVLIPGPTLDAGNARDFKTEFAPLIGQGAQIVLNLSNLKFVDSSGLGALLSGLRQINGLGGEMKLCALAKPVRALVELVRMHRVFEIYNTEEEALRSFAAGPAVS